MLRNGAGVTAGADPLQKFSGYIGRVYSVRKPDKTCALLSTSSCFPAIGVFTEGASDIRVKR